MRALNLAREGNLLHSGSEPKDFKSSGLRRAVAYHAGHRHCHCQVGVEIRMENMPCKFLEVRPHVFGSSQDLVFGSSQDRSAALRRFNIIKG